MIKTVNILGAGNVGFHLAKVLSSKVRIKGVFSKNIDNAQSLAEMVNAKGTNEIGELPESVDLNIICLKDDVIAKVAQDLPKEIPIVHTSGSIGIEVLKDFSKNGILYPLQTFSKNRELLISEIPFLIEGNTQIFENELAHFCKTNLSEHIEITNTESRAVIHLAAVISNNFMTALLEESNAILSEINLDLNLLKPLIEETIKKAFEMGPKSAQTGPAKRQDFKVIAQQIDRIKTPQTKELYKQITALILSQQESNS
ncbi:MAG: Rossmann-like and DUF2520 domain-containing protein [Putridiphycobacter sp.]